MRRFTLIALMASLLAGGILFARVAGASDTQPEVAVVVPVVDGTTDPRGFAVRVQQALDSMGVVHTVIRETDLGSTDLRDRSVLVLPYATKLAAPTVQTLLGYGRAGGKLIVFYGMPDPLAAHLGVAPCSYVSDDGEGRFSFIRFGSRAVEGLPAAVYQNSWAALKARANHGTKAIGTWVDSAGRDTGEPAAFLSENGAVIGHVFTMEDTERKAFALLCLVGHFAPAQWERSYRALRARPFTPDAVRAEIQACASKVTGQRCQTAERRLAASLRMHAEAHRRVLAGKHPRAVARLVEARTLLESARYPLATGRREPELRGVFIARPWTVRDWGRLACSLRRMGMNAVFPYFCSAGVAHYPSYVVPPAPEVKAGRDPLAECIDGCRRYGIEVHVWHNALHTEDADSEVQAGLDTTARLVRSADGRSLPKLCPSRGANRYYEQRVVRELMDRYPITGINLDYVRYPNWPPDYCYCEICRRRFERDCGQDASPWPTIVTTGALNERYLAWSQAQITGVIRAIHEEVERAQRKCVLSADAFGWPGTRTRVGQDLDAWLRGQLVDFVCFMDYTLNREFFRSLVLKQAEEVRRRCPMVIGLGAFSHVGVFPSPRVLLDQVETTRACGADGFIIYQYNDFLRQEFLPALADSATATWVRPSASRGMGGS